MVKATKENQAKVDSALGELDLIFGSRERTLAVVVSDFVRLALLGVVDDEILGKLDSPDEVCSLWVSQRRVARGISTVEPQFANGVAAA